MSEIKKTTVQEIAKLAGVSAMTVSRVVNNKPGVAEHTKKRVEEIIRELEYYPSSVARRMSGKAAKSLCILANQETLRKSTHSITFDSEIWRLLIAEGCEQGFQISVAASDHSDGGKPNYMRLAEERSVSGFILLDMSDYDERLENLRKLNIPVVLLGRANAPFSHGYAVGTDDHHGGRIACDYLIRKGYQRIAYLSFPSVSSPARLRLAGYREAMNYHNLEVNENLICFNQRVDEEISGYEGMKQLLESKSPPDAIFCTSDLRAIGAIRALNEAGLNVPGDVAVVGYDDLVFAQYISTPLTTVRQPFPEIVQQTIRIFTQLEQQKEPEKNVFLFPGELVQRSSA